MDSSTGETGLECYRLISGKSKCRRGTRSDRVSVGVNVERLEPHSDSH